MKKAILFLGIIFVSLFAFTFDKAEAYASCSEYGIWAYADYDGYCKCASGYVFGKDVLGNTTCVSGDSVCWDKYGYNSRYSSLNNSCECSYGYVFGKDSIGRTQCVSPDQMCKDDLGYNSRYNSLSDKCECSYGYVISGGQCTNGNTYCSLKHGIYAEYDALDNQCQCEDGYTFDDSYQCVKKQNNVYFFLKELDEDDDRAIIQSTNNYQDYLVSYGVGCISIGLYEGRNIVVNLGTDFYINLFDKIVLPNQSQTCNIMDFEEVDSDFTFEKQEEEPVYFYTPPKPAPAIQQTKPTEVKKTEVKPVVKPQESKTAQSTSTNNEEKSDSSPVLQVETVNNSSTTISTTTPPAPQKKEFWVKRLWHFLFKKK